MLLQVTTYIILYHRGEVTNMDPIWDSKLFHELIATCRIILMKLQIFSYLFYQTYGNYITAVVSNEIKHIFRFS